MKSVLQIKTWRLSQVPAVLSSIFNHQFTRDSLPFTCQVMFGHPKKYEIPKLQHHLDFSPRPTHNQSVLQPDRATDRAGQKRQYADSVRRTLVDNVLDNLSPREVE